MTEREREMSNRRPARRPSFAGPRIEVPYRVEEADPSDGSWSGPDLQQVLGALRRNIWIVLGAVVISLAAAGYLISREVRSYQASATLRLVDWNAAMVGGDATEGPTPVGTADPILSEIMVIQSREVLGGAADSAGLRLFDAETQKPVSFVEKASVTLPPEESAEIRLEFGPREITYVSGGERGTAPYGESVEVAGARFTVPERPESERVTISIVPRTTAALYLAGGLTALPRANTSGIDVHFKSTEPTVAVRAVNEIVKVYQEKNAETARENLRRKRVFLEEQLHATDSLLMVAQGNLSGLRTRNQAYSAQDKFSAAQANLIQVEMRQAELRANLQMYESVLDRLMRARSSNDTDQWSALVALPGIASDPMVGQMHSQLLQYRNERDAMVAGPWSRAPTHPEVQRLDNLIASTEERLIGAVRSHIQSVRAQINALGGLRGHSAAQMGNLPAVEVQEMYLTQNMGALQQTADRLREQYEAVRLEEAGEAGQVEIVQLASFAVPSASGPGFKLLLGLITGLLLGGGLALLRERLDRSINRPEEIEDMLLVPNLAVIPRTATLALGPGRKKEEENGPPPKKRKRGEIDPSLGAEAYRILRTNLLFSEERDLRTLVVTSATPGEGKTTTAVNLAVAYAQQGLRVLLMECDLRRPNLQRFFEGVNGTDLSKVLLENRHWVEAVHPSGVHGLDILLSGEAFPRAAEALSSPTMKRLLDQLANEYDLVVLDSSPLLVAADAAALGAIADGVLLVVRATHTDRKTLQRAMHQLEIVGARVVGTVLNDPDGSIDRYGGSYYYNYTYEA